MSARLAKIDAIQRDRERVGAELSAVALTEELLQRIEKAAAAVDRTGDQLALISAAVEFTAIADIELAVGEQRVSLVGGPELVGHRHRTHRGRGSRRPDGPGHPRRDRARRSGQTCCSTTRAGRCADGRLRSPTSRRRDTPTSGAANCTAAVTG